MNILIVNQSVIDMFASFFTLLTAVVEVDGTRMSHNDFYDQLMCRIWLTRMPLWDFLVTSTYGIFLMAVERYIAVVHPVWYSSKVRKLVFIDSRYSLHYFYFSFSLKHYSGSHLLMYIVSKDQSGNCTENPHVCTD